MILLIDNYDSFSYNLVQLVGKILKRSGTKKEEIQVIRNDELTVRQIKALSPSRLILSPGPGRPKQAGICEDVVKTLGDQIPILGVCLGHQAICEAFGGEIMYAQHLMHGKQSEIELDLSCLLFEGMPKRIQVARYHSLIAAPNTLPQDLFVTARDVERGEIMGVQHRKWPIYGVQFHPESVLTPDGEHIMERFLNIKKEKGGE